MQKKEYENTISRKKVKHEGKVCRRKNIIISVKEEKRPRISLRFHRLQVK